MLKQGSGATSMSWTIYKKDGNGAGILALEDGLRLKYAEDPDSPGREAQETLGERLSGLSVVITPPCSAETLAAIASKAPKLRKIFVADENPERLKLWEESMKPSELPCEAILTDSELEKAIYEKLSDFNADMMRGRSAVYVPARFRRLESGFSSSLERAVLAAQKKFCASAAYQTTRSWHVIMNYILNTLYTEREIYSIPKGFSADCITIVGAGPSLNDNIEILAKYQDRTFIIACDAALNALIEHGIRVDLVASIEDLLQNWRLFTKHPDEYGKLNLAMPLCGNSLLPRNYKGKIIFTGEDATPLFFKEFRDTVANIERGQCVGHFAFNMAMKLKPGEIIMTGFDLALKNGQYHCKSMATPYYDEHPEAFSLTDVKGNDGSILKTETALLMYLRHFEGLVKDSGIKVINATAGGAFIKGTVLMTLEEALKDKPPKPQLSLGENTAFAKIDKTSHIAKLKNDLTEAQRIIEKASDEAEKMTKERFRNPFAGMPLESPVFELIRGVSSFLQITELLSALAALEQTGFEEFMRISRENLDEFKSSVGFLQELLESAHGKGGGKYLILGTEKADIPELPTGGNVIYADPGLQLFEIWKMARENEVGTLIAFDGQVIPDTWSLPRLNCIDIKTVQGTGQAERYLWLPGYKAAGADEKITKEWRKILPSDVDCNTIGEIFD